MTTQPNNIELSLLTRVMDDKDFHSLEKAQITEEFFVTNEGKELYRYLRNFYHNPETAGHVPSRDFVRISFPGFYPLQAPDPVPVLASYLRREKVKMSMLTLAQRLTEQCNLDPMAAMAALKAQTSEISALAEVGQDLSLSSAFSQLRDRYEIVQNSGGVIGIPFPWEILNEELQGMQGSQFIVLYGRPKSMKSWVAIYMAVHAYISSRRRVLFYTREMAPILVAQRAAACIARLDYKTYKNGKLQPAHKKHLFGILQDMMDDETSLEQYTGVRQPYFKITSDRGGGANSGGGVAWLQAKIRELKPDIVFVDGMYLMKDDRSNTRSVDWKNITHISQDMKLTCQEFDVPLVGVTQANRAADKSKGTDLTELAYADALGQDADAVIRISKKTAIDEASKQKRTKLYLTFPGVREADFDGLIINGQPATDFSFVAKIDNTEEEEKEKTYGQKPTYRRSFSDPVIPSRPMGT